jgi:hypothetical protein
MENVTLTPYSEGELKTLIYDMVQMALSTHSPQQIDSQEPFIKGIHELAKFLKVSPARAQKLKNENAFPYWQDGRTLLFDRAKLMQAMMSKNTK